MSEVLLCGAIRYRAHNVDARWNVPARASQHKRDGATMHKIESIHEQRSVERAPPTAQHRLVSDRRCMSANFSCP
jgi:hypothetical protein